MRSLTEYRENLERIRGGTVPVDLALEIMDAAEQEITERSGEFTITQAVEISGRSRSWYERRLEPLQRDGLARQLPNGLWLLKYAAVAGRAAASGAFDPALEADDIATRLVAGL